MEIVTVLKYKGVKRRSPSAAIGDMAIVSVKKGTPEMRRELVHAVIVRCRRAFRRAAATPSRWAADCMATISDTSGRSATS